MHAPPLKQARPTIASSLAVPRQTGVSARLKPAPAIGDERGRDGSAAEALRVADGPIRRLAATLFIGKHETESRRSSGRRDPLCLKRLSTKRLLIARDGESSKQSQRCVFVEGGLAQATSRAGSGQLVG